MVTANTVANKINDKNHMLIRAFRQCCSML